jgi:hypothetical protein
MHFTNGSFIHDLASRGGLGPAGFRKEEMMLLVAARHRFLAACLLLILVAACAPEPGATPTEEPPYVSVHSVPTSTVSIPTSTVSIPYAMLLTTPTVLRVSAEMVDDYYVLTVNADRVLPEPEELSDGGRIDFVWFVDVDNNKETGQTSRGNDFNIHAYINEFGWATQVFPVSSSAIATEEDRRAFEDVEVDVFDTSFKLSVPASVLFHVTTFNWSLEAFGSKSTPEWQEILAFPFVSEEYTFGP